MGIVFTQLLLKLYNILFFITLTHITFGRLIKNILLFFKKFKQLIGFAKLRMH